MEKLELLKQEIEKCPEPLIEEVLSFVLFLKSRKLGLPGETLLMAESALRKDWLSAAEEEAWRDL
jgi:hypothetical protein